MKEGILSFFSFISDRIWDLMPSNPIAYLIYLLIIVIFSLILIFYFARKKRKTKKDIPQENRLTISTLLDIASNPKSTKDDLLMALKLFNENFRVKDDKRNAFKFFSKVLNHKNRDKMLFSYFHGNIIPNNLEFKEELDSLEKTILNR